MPRHARLERDHGPLAFRKDDERRASARVRPDGVKSPRSLSGAWSAHNEGVEFPGDGRHRRRDRRTILDAQRRSRICGNRRSASACFPRAGVRKAARTDAPGCHLCARRCTGTSGLDVPRPAPDRDGSCRSCSSRPRRRRAVRFARGKSDRGFLTSHRGPGAHRCDPRRAQRGHSEARECESIAGLRARSDALTPRRARVLLHVV